MSEPQTSSPAPRRSQRDKKTVKPFISAASTPATRKRKRQEPDAEEDASASVRQEAENNALSEDENDADEEGDGYEAPKAKSTAATRKGKAKGSPKAKGAPAARKPRTEKVVLPKVTKPVARKGRKVKEGEDTYDAEQVAKDTNILGDNPLFNAIMNPSRVLQASIEDYVVSLQETPGRALAELINLVLRSCGCNDSVDADQALDYDGIVSTLDDFTESLKQENSPVYPLTSKLPVFKRFRRSLSEWIERLVISCSDLGLLYTSDMMETLQQWVVSMSSSQIRSFRHTATVIALEAETALCDVAASIHKEAEVLARQQEGEKKRKGPKSTNTRLKELESKAKEVEKRKSTLLGFIKEFVDGVFVHRFRDLDPNIRAECVRALGLWLKKYPEHFLDAHYLRYVGWVLSDSNNHVRLEAIKSLSGVYDQTLYLGSLNHFTERIKPRLLEMATSDTDLSIRVAVIQVLGAIETHTPLGDEEQEKLCLLLFDEEPRVRRAVSSFVRAVWEEAVSEQLESEHKPTDQDKSRIGMKVLASLIVKWCKSLDAISGDAEESESGVNQVNGTRSNSKRRKEVLALVRPGSGSRVALAVEALWDEVDAVKDWEGILDLLLLDHSATDEDAPLGATARPRGRANGKKVTHELSVDRAWRLEEQEETTLLEVLVVSIRETKEDSSGGKKGEEENVSNDITRALIKALPRLFIKHQTDTNRIADILVLPTLMNLDLYLEMRMIAAYTSLWDDVIKQYTTHSSAKVLSHSMSAILHFMEATSLSNANATKISELEDELSTQLRDIIAGRDEIEITTFSEDEIISLVAWCTRLAILAGTRNMTKWIEDDEGGKQSSAWDILNALVERGRLGYKEEETMIEQSLHVLSLHIIWKTTGLALYDESSPDDSRYKDTLLEQREALLEKLLEYAVGTQSNTVEGVKRASFKHLLDLHILFSTAHAYTAEGTLRPTATLPLMMDDETQYRCAGYIQAEIERYAELLGDDDNASIAGDSAGSGDDADGADGDRPKPAKRKAKKLRPEEDDDSRDVLEREYLFLDVISTFLRAIRAGAINVRHGSVILAHYGRLQPTFDTCAKVIVDALREEKYMAENPQSIAEIVAESIQDAYTLVLEGIVRDEYNSIQLAKLLSSCFVVRGSQLSIMRRLPVEYIVQVQITLLSWVSKKLAGYVNSKNKKSLNASLAFFKVLVPLISSIGSRDALKIKAHMDQVFDEDKVEVQTTKAWEPLKAYEKRLSTAMAKDNPVKPKKSKKKETVSEDESDGEQVGDDQEERPPPVPKRRSGRLNRNANGGATDEGTTDEEQAPTTPKARPKPRAVGRRGGRKTVTPEAEAEPEAEPDLASLPGSPLRSLTPSEPSMETQDEIEEDNTVTPKANRKRQRDVEQDDEPDTNGTAEPEQDNEPATPDVQVRRKRARH